MSHYEYYAVYDVHCYTIHMHILHSKNAVEHERFGNCLTNVIQKIWYIFCQTFTALISRDATVYQQPHLCQEVFST